jgi:hypothetical protein
MFSDNDTSGQLCVMNEEVYVNNVHLNGNSTTWNIIANLHEKLANHVWA